MSSRNFSRTFKNPLRPYEKERMTQELKLVGEYGLKNKREVWRVQYTISKIRNAARALLQLPENDQKRIFEGTALVRRLHKLGILDEDKKKLDYVLSLTINDLLDRRLQTMVFKNGKARSIHQARSFISHRHISLGNQLVDQAAFLVWKDSEKDIKMADTSVLSTEKAGRIKRMKNKPKKGNDSD